MHKVGYFEEIVTGRDGQPVAILWMNDPANMVRDFHRLSDERLHYWYLHFEREKRCYAETNELRGECVRRGLMVNDLSAIVGQRTLF